MAAVGLMASLFDEAAGEASSVSSREPPPTWRSLAIDNLMTKARRGARAVGTVLAHPVRAVQQLAVFLGGARRVLTTTRAPRTSLIQRVRAGRRIGFIRLDLDIVREAAHQRGAKVNDVVLDVWTGGLRHLLVNRGEDLAGAEPVTTVPTSRRPQAIRAEAPTKSGPCRSPCQCGSRIPNAAST